MLSLKVQPSCIQRAAGTVTPKLCHASTCRRAFRARAVGSTEEYVTCTPNAPTTDRRALIMATLAGVGASWTMAVDSKAEGEYSTFLGLATPPTSYGGYGGNANEPPKYTFEYPKGWKEEVPSKVEKGTQGIDGRVVNPRAKDQRAFVITLARAGEDNKTFQLRDTESTFAGFAGADYDLQDALSSATSTERTERDVDGIRFFDYDIDSPDYRYLSSIGVKEGKVFALFVRSPARSFKNTEPALRHIVETFRLL